jgi:hypothetical protein
MNTVIGKILNESLNKFTVDVDADIVVPSGAVYNGVAVEDSNTPSRITVSFEIEGEWRSWGLKSAMISLVGELSFGIQVMVAGPDSDQYGPRDVDVDVVIDTSNVPAISATTVPITIDSIRVELDKNLNPVKVEISQ